MNIEKLRKFCLLFPHATEDVKWGNDLCFCVGAKMFCVTDLETGSNISLKCTPEEFAELIERYGIIPAPYVARYHWVRLESLDSIEEAELKGLISTSYDLVFNKLPAKIRNHLSK